VRRLRESGAQVRVVMTAGAGHFITATTLQALSGHPVRSTLWDEAAEAAMGHIELARWATRVLIAPATADLIARLAQGRADDLLTTLCLATEAPLAIAPAMNRMMWAHVATQANVAVLRQRGVVILGPAAGEQACGETGPGRMLEAAEIHDALVGFFQPKVLAGRRIMLKHLLPNAAGPLIVIATLELARLIVTEAALSFLGLSGVPPEIPSWGQMLADGREVLFFGGWWVATFPGIAISLLVLGINLFGDALAEVLDPRSR